MNETLTKLQPFMKTFHRPNITWDLTEKQRNFSLLDFFKAWTVQKLFNISEQQNVSAPGSDEVFKG